MRVYLKPRYSPLSHLRSIILVWKIMRNISRRSALGFPYVRGKLKLQGSFVFEYVCILSSTQ